MKIVKVIVIILIILFPAVVLPATFEVTIDENGFNPASLTIMKGDTVKWVNTGTSPHSVTSGGIDFSGNSEANGFFVSGIFNPGLAFEHTFTVPGDFSYFDGLVGSPPSRRGVISVEGIAISPGDSALLITRSFDLVFHVAARHPDLAISVVLDGTLVFDGPYLSFRILADQLGIETILTGTGALATIISVQPYTLSDGAHSLSVKVSDPSGFSASDDVTYVMIDRSDFSQF